MNKAYKLMYGMVVISLLFSIVSTDMVMAVGTSPGDIVEVAGDAHQVRVNASNRVQFRFRQRTRLTFNSNVNIDLDADCDALNIGDKDFMYQDDSYREFRDEPSVGPYFPERTVMGSLTISF